MKLITLIIVVDIILLIVLILLYYKFAILSILNSHFGTNFSTKESDNKRKKNNNLISILYDNEINRNIKYSPFKNNVTPEKIPIIDIGELTKDKFITLTNNFTTPIVVKKFFINTPAVKKWNLEYFQNKYGNTILPVIKDGSIKNHKKNLYQSEGSYEFITLKQFIQNIKNNKKSYVNNVSRIFSYHPELIDDMKLENIKPFTGIEMKDTTNVTHIFIGGKDTGSSLHCSITGNFFYNVKGQKLWYLIDPKYTPYLSPSISRTGLFAVSHFDICNAKNGDYILNIPRYEILLDEGDLLFNPPWWWHAITNKTDYVIACANRFSSFDKAFKNNPLYSLIFFSHPIANYKDFHGNVKTREEANLHFDKALLGDILKREKIK